jgi:DNA repair protein RadC
VVFTPRTAIYAATTEMIMRAASVLSMPVLDHIIVTRDMHRYHSMSEQGTLPKVPA